MIRCEPCLKFVQATYKAQSDTSVQAQLLIVYKGGKPWFMLP